MDNPLSIPDLIGGGWRTLAFEPFREGIEICRLYDDEASGASAAVLRYAPGAHAPRHVHTGYEHVVILEGSQSDERGTYETGAFTINPPGFLHEVRSPAGCAALLIWHRPVAFVAGA